MTKLFDEIESGSGQMEPLWGDVAGFAIENPGWFVKSGAKLLAGHPQLSEAQTTHNGVEQEQAAALVSERGRHLLAAL